MKVQELDTPATGAWSRDCELIYFCSYNGIKLIYYMEENKAHWEAKIYGLVAYKFICEEFSSVGYLENLPVEGAFYEIVDSPWLNEFNDFQSETINKCKHFVLQFYDATIEIIAQNLSFEPLKEKPPGIEHYSFQKWDDQGRSIPD